MYENPPGTFFNTGVIIFKCLLLYRLCSRGAEGILYFSVWSDLNFCFQFKAPSAHFDNTVFLLFVCFIFFFQVEPMWYTICSLGPICGPQRERAIYTVRPMSVLKTMIGTLMVLLPNNTVLCPHPWQILHYYNGNKKWSLFVLCTLMRLEDEDGF